MDMLKWRQCGKNRRRNTNPEDTVMRKYTMKLILAGMIAVISSTAPKAGPEPASKIDVVVLSWKFIFAPGTITTIDGVLAHRRLCSQLRAYQAELSALRQAPPSKTKLEPVREEVLSGLVRKIAHLLEDRVKQC